MRKLTAKSVDMTGKKCTKCNKGKYHETSHMDDMDGVLHCTKCNHQVDRWKNTVKEDATGVTPQNSMGAGGIETFSPLLKPKPLRKIIPNKKELKADGK
jgi:hypothetical protein